MNARKIPLTEIRRRLLQEHEQLGLIRAHPDEYYTTLSREQVEKRLLELHELVESDWTTDELIEKLKQASCTRLLKLWHDHSKIAGHSHILVLVATVYTTEEMQHKGVNIDVPNPVEDP